MTQKAIAIVFAPAFLRTPLPSLNRKGSSAGLLDESGVQDMMKNARYSSGFVELLILYYQNVTPTSLTKAFSSSSISKPTDKTPSVPPPTALDQQETVVLRSTATSTVVGSVPTASTSDFDNKQKAARPRNKSLLGRASKFFSRSQK